jgi:hypothetical protein
MGTGSKCLANSFNPTEGSVFLLWFPEHDMELEGQTGRVPGDLDDGGAGVELMPGLSEVQHQLSTGCGG